MPATFDYILWYSRNLPDLKYRQIWRKKENLEKSGYTHCLVDGVEKLISDCDDAEISRGRIYTRSDLTKPGPGSKYEVSFQGNSYSSGARWWGTPKLSLERLFKADRVSAVGKNLRFRRFLDDNPYLSLSNFRDDTGIAGFASDKRYVVETLPRVIERCLLTTTDPGDLVLDPTCGSGTTATVAEQWGRRWITMDTSRVALALARTRVMSARYPYYYLADTLEGRTKEQELTGKIQPETITHGDLRQGFVYQRAPRVTLSDIANNAEIDVISEEFQAPLDSLRKGLNGALGKAYEEWEIPRSADKTWSDSIKHIHEAWWENRIARQKRIDESIAKAADVEFLYDRPYEDKSRVRVAGPFTVESLSPHRVVPADQEELLDVQNAAAGKRRRSKFVTPPSDFAAVVLDNLRSAGVHQSEKDAIKFNSLQGWPGEYIGAEGVFAEGQAQRRAGIFLGPEFGTVSRVDLVAAAREATEARFDVLIACAFNFDAHASELSKLGPLPILKAKMNPDLHMADELKNTGKGNLFVVFGEPDIDVKTEKDGNLRVQVKGIDVFDPNTGDIRSSDTDAIAAWFIDTDYDEENFFVRHAYFLGAQDPYKSLKTALKAEIDEEAWATLYRDTSRPFPRPSTGRIAVKVINHFGDEVMKVFTV
jgi:adenine-specific DNA-methyltransferase